MPRTKSLWFQLMLWFSLRNLLVATTLIAVVLGLAVWAAKIAHAGE